MPEPRSMLRSVLPLSMAATPNRGSGWNDEPASLTSMVVDERCDGCLWPRVCEGDRTCWRLEAERPWRRTRLDLGRSGTGGPAVAWTAVTAVEAFRGFVVEHGRFPSADEISRASGLPSYSTCLRLGVPVAGIRKQLGVKRTRARRR